MIYWKRVCVAVTAGLVLSGCFGEPTTQELVDEWQVAIAKYAEGIRGGNAQELAGVEMKAQMKVLRRAEKGDPYACFVVAVNSVGKGLGAEKAGDRIDMKSHFRHAYPYLQCAEKRQSELSEADQRNVQKLLKNLPQHL